MPPTERTDIPSDTLFGDVLPPGPWPGGFEHFQSDEHDALHEFIGGLAAGLAGMRTRVTRFRDDDIVSLVEDAEAIATRVHVLAQRLARDTPPLPGVDVNRLLSDIAAAMDAGPEPPSIDLALAELLPAAACSREALATMLLRLLRCSAATACGSARLDIETAAATLLVPLGALPPGPYVVIAIRAQLPHGRAADRHEREKERLSLHRLAELVQGHLEFDTDQNPFSARLYLAACGSRRGDSQASSPTHSYTRV